MRGQGRSVRVRRLLAALGRWWGLAGRRRWGFPLCHDDVPDPVSISHFTAR